MGFSTRWAFRRELPRELADPAWETFDHGTQRAILKLYRSAPPDVLARAGERLADVRAPALVLWSEDDPYLPAEFARLHADALGGEVTLELVDGGHWPWLTRPELVARVGDFVG
jgi:pimeloyl-ACP methyl ester carboxylesterase